MARICPEIDDHEWVEDTHGNTVCQACGLAVEDCGEAHSFDDIAGEQETDPVCE